MSGNCALKHVEAGVKATRLSLSRLYESLGQAKSVTTT